MQIQKESYRFGRGTASPESPQIAIRHGIFPKPQLLAETEVGFVQTRVKDFLRGAGTPSRAVKVIACGAAGRRRPAAIPSGRGRLRGIRADSGGSRYTR